MADLNRCTFIGYLGRAPSVSYTPSGVACANFSIAVTEKWKTQDGEQKEQTEWIKCTAWKRLAEICGEYLDKGSHVWASGKMQTRKWETKEGETRYTTEIVLRELQMLDRKGAAKHSTGNQAPPGNTPDDGDIPF